MKSSSHESSGDELRGRDGPGHPRDAGATREATVEELVGFCRQRLRCFAEWPEDILRKWLAWHVEWNGLVWACNPVTGRICGIGIGVRLNESDLDRHWHFDPAGDSFLFEAAATSRPGVLAALVEQFQRQFPDSPRLKLFARRYKKGRRVAYRAGFLDKLTRLAT